MSIRHKKYTILTILSLVLSLSISATAQIRAYQVTDRQVQTLLDRIEVRSNSFRNLIDRSLDRSAVDGTTREDSINTLIANYETATDRLRDNFLARRSTVADAQDVLNQAARVDRFVRNNRLSTRIQGEWNLLRADLDTLAGYYRIQSNWNSDTGGTGVGPIATALQLRTLLNRLSARGISFRQSYTRWQRYGGRNQFGDITQDINDFQGSVDDLRLDYRNADTAMVNAVLEGARSINRFVADARPTTAVSNSWTLIKTDLETLASYYRVSWNWDGEGIGNPGSIVGSFDTRLTGSYRLNVAQSDNVDAIVERAVVNANYTAIQEDRMRRNLERRLQSPGTLMIEKRGRTVMFASGNGAAVELTADGTSRSETSPNGRTVRTSVTATNRDLTINYEGERMNDYFLTLMPVNNGQLRVTRRVYLENQNTQVTVASVYDKTGASAIFSNTDAYPPASGSATTNNRFYIPNNTGVVATLNTPISTRTAKDGDVFSMTVTSPSQYRDAVISGTVIGERSGVVSGRANLQLRFDSIQLRNGERYQFAGIVDQVREADGDVVTVNNEGQIRDSSQTRRTVTRAGIGAALGAIIGAVVGGGSGAAIGAGVGAGAGAGSVILQGRDNLELESGSTFTITATSPGNTRN
ncbi:MAG: hypothetical protein WKF34_02870 [Pyrinomonadaceae bacterium]